MKKNIFAVMFYFLHPSAAFSQGVVIPPASPVTYEVLYISECRLSFSAIGETWSNIAYVEVGSINRQTNLVSSSHQTLGSISWNQFTYPPRGKESIPLQQCRQARRGLVLRTQALQPGFEDNFSNDILGK